MQPNGLLPVSDKVVSVPTPPPCIPRLGCMHSSVGMGQYVTRVPVSKIKNQKSKIDERIEQM